MKSFAFMFPGQGSQSVGMVDAYYAVNPDIKTYFERASDCLAVDLWEIVTQDSSALLDRTEYTQPCLLVAGVCAWETWCQLSEYRPTVLAGHSLGEYTALVCAGALDFDVAVKLVAQRGQFMQAAIPEGELSLIHI